MTDTEDMNGIGRGEDAPGDPAVIPLGIDWDALDARLASSASASASSLPSYRRVWFLSLIRQGREAEASGRAALAAHCRLRLEQECAAFGISATSSFSAQTGSGTSSRETLRVDPAGTPAHPGSTTATPRTHSGTSPLAALAHRREAASRARLLELLDRHATRLGSDEVEVFRQALAGVAETGAASISDLRRRLVDRLIRSARYRRHAARLKLWKPALPDSIPAGPYNDYQAVEELLHRLLTANAASAEWAAEFLDIYADMRDVRLAYGTLLPGTTKN
jgi:hypothetical protein